MIKQTYLLKLASPAFLGGADQRGAWRTPPIKALLREWWRIAMAHRLGYDHRQIKNHETRLFGTAADEAGGENHRSQIRLSLAHWHEGTMHSHEPLPMIYHPEAERAKNKVEPLNYLGYGPIDRGKLKFGAALQSKESNILRIALPNSESESPNLQCALTLAHWFGTVGGRSRNGWGSIVWAPEEGTPTLAPLSASALEASGCTRALEQSLEVDWPHAIGSDGAGVLVWRSRETFRDWHEAMTFLARTKIAFRTHLEFNGGQPHPAAQPRHALAYPVTNHKVSAWEGSGKGRLANTLRFKLHIEAEGRLRALIYHTPCKPTLPHADLDLLNTWQRVHRFLDAQPTLARLA
ncbi:RAMP superfamily CRISPR-associated protein [Thauera sp. JM12B12]|uniref:RAMP superfamily CRISPR-associated protein n=1 Tax=Thauera sp. JM12B12 TaxID=3142262 RepID=UPI0031F3C9E2